MLILILFTLLLLTVSTLPLPNGDEEIGSEELGSEEIGEIKKQTINKKCLLNPEKSENCYKSYKEVATDLHEWGFSFTFNNEHPSNGSKGIIIGAPNVFMPLQLVELAVKEDENINNSPVGYLTTFGYVKGIIKATCNDGEIVNKDVLVDSLQVYQKIANIEQSGSLDNDVWSTMQVNRCGMPDINLDSDGNIDESSLKLIESVIGQDKVREHRRRKRWVTAQYRLDKTDLVYKLLNFTPTIPQIVQSRDIDKAIQRWDDASPLTFTKAAGDEEPDIKLSFEPKVHGDGIPFEEGVMAHAFYPKTIYEGQVHFDATENWNSTSSDPQKANLPWVATHEIGHVLGLQHSLDPGAIMYFKHGDNVGSPELRDDDIAGIQYLYGNVITRCKVNWDGYESKCYKVETRTNAISWTAAQEQCRSIGGEMASSSTSGINSFISTISIGYTPVWIGKDSSLDTWSDGTVWSYIPSDSNLNVRGKNTQCLTATFEAGALIWDYVKCKDPRVKNFICQTDQELETEAPPITATQPATDTTPLTCEDKVKAALRRGNFLYLFGASHYYKYLLKVKTGPPKLQPGYPKSISRNLPDLPEEFNAVFNDPANNKRIYFVSGGLVYGWKLKTRYSTIEKGKLNPLKSRKMKKKFGTTDILTAAVKFDRDSVFMFSYNKVSKWTKSAGYEQVTKWDYFNPNDADAISECKWAGWFYVFRDKEYFLFRKSDGKISKMFTRKIESDFEKLKLCDYVAPIIREDETEGPTEEGPENLSEIEEGPYPEQSPNDSD